MIILIRKRLIWGSALFLCFFVCFFVCFAAVLWAGHGMDIPVFAAREEVPVTVVIDPGHGGEDGGAVSTDGVEESQINLAISRQVNDLLRFAGQRTVMTRTEDVSICDEGLSTVRQRKASDIRNRVSIVNSRENAVLVSIHQNSLPSSTVTHGAQVFWNQQEGAEALAEAIQTSLNGSINVGNEKHTKQIPPTVYLMNHVTVPAVLVECGFLTNQEETRRLQDETHQRTLAISIAAGYLRGTSEGELS